LRYHSTRRKRMRVSGSMARVLARQFGTVTPSRRANLQDALPGVGLQRHAPGQPLRARRGFLVAGASTGSPGFAGWEPTDPVHIGAAGGSTPACVPKCWARRRSSACRWRCGRVRPTGPEVPPPVSAPASISPHEGEAGALVLAEGADGADAVDGLRGARPCRSGRRACADRGEASDRARSARREQRLAAVGGDEDLALRDQARSRSPAPAGGRAAARRRRRARWRSGAPCRR
jgi:hypothetical protein